MYVSFYTKMDPSEHRNTIISSFDEAGFYNVKSLGKYIFTRSGIEKSLNRIHCISCVHKMFLRLHMY